jgi:AcrR family transcriptional regulator
VADALGILKGSLYYYIKTKEDLLYWLLEAAHESVEVILGEAPSFGVPVIHHDPHCAGSEA